MDQNASLHAVQFSREFPEGLVYLSHIRSSVPVHSSEFCVGQDPGDEVEVELLGVLSQEYVEWVEGMFTALFFL